jgi:hypothetical protein
VTLRWVKKRDGRRVPFDARKLAGSIEAAARAAGEAEEILAAELAEVVALFLERDFRERIPETTELADLAERVLLETNHARTAAVYAEGRKLRDRTRAEIVVVRDGAPLVAPDGEPLSAPPGEPWNEGRIVAALVHRCRLAPDLAEEVAASVESKIFALGLRRVPATLIREVIDAELAERGFHARIGRPGELAVPAEDVRRLLVAFYVRRGEGSDAVLGGPEAVVGIDVLTRFALAEVYPEHVAEASRDGRIHIQDVGRPLRLATGAISLEAVKLGAAAVLPGPSGGSPPRAPRDASELGLALGRTIAWAARYHARALGVPYANVFLAPMLRGKEAAARRAVRDFLRLLPASGPGPLTRLHVGRVPAALADAPAVGPGGRRWRATYGELRAEADRTARLILEVAAEERALGIAPITVEVADEEGLALLDGSRDATIVAPGLAPQASRALASAAQVAAALGPVPRLIAAGTAQIVALNCAAAAYRAGRGDEPAFRRELDRALDLAIEAIRAKWAFLENALYRPDLPLWAGAAAPKAAERARGRAAFAAAPDLPVVEARSAVSAIGLVGLDEAYIFLTGEPPAHNPAVARLAGDAIGALALRARAEGARHGFVIQLEEPELDRASRRLADLDLQATPAAREVLGLDSAATEVRYSTGLGGAPVLFEAVYRPVGIAPYIAACEDAAARAAGFLAVATSAPAAREPGAETDPEATPSERGVLTP